MVSELKVDVGDMLKIRSSATKFEVEKFKKKGNSGLWKKRVKTLLVQYDLHKTLHGKSAKHAYTLDEN